MLLVASRRVFMRDPASTIRPTVRCSESATSMTRGTPSDQRVLPWRGSGGVGVAGSSPAGGARRLCGIKRLNDRLIVGPSSCRFVVASSGTNGVDERPGLATAHHGVAATTRRRGESGPVSPVPSWHAVVWSGASPERGWTNYFPTSERDECGISRRIGHLSRGFRHGTLAPC